jgi:uncharacterized Fe-S cluster-containing radical SAM superfamily protein
MSVDSDRLSERYRAAMVDTAHGRILVSVLSGSNQERDLSAPVNCAGVGRIRHFKRCSRSGWVENPLPIDPASRSLGLRENLREIEAQVFQNAACNWRCWYCFVPFELLAADPSRSAWYSAKALVDMYAEQMDRACILDLSGGQPELTPEWVVWMMRELQNHGLSDSTYLWSDDNLSNDFFGRHLSEGDRDFVQAYSTYGRVGCFKGYDQSSFSYNTAADPTLFDRQFEIMDRYLRTGIDMYAYVTFTSAESSNVRDGVRGFVDRLQSTHKNLPLRTVPLEVRVFSPVIRRLNDRHRCAIKNQWFALEAWQRELEDRFSSEDRQRRITDIDVSKHG